MKAEDKKVLLSTMLMRAFPEGKVEAWAWRGRVMALVQLADRDLFLSACKKVANGWWFEVAVAKRSEQIRHYLETQLIMETVFADVGMSTGAWYGFRPLGDLEHTIAMWEKRKSWTGSMSMHEVLAHGLNPESEVETADFSGLAVWLGKYDDNLTGLKEEAEAFRQKGSLGL